MSFDANAILASMLIGSVGLFAFMVGKRRGRFLPMAIGFTLMIFPYFVSNVWLMFGIAAILLVGLWIGTRVFS